MRFKNDKEGMQRIEDQATQNSRTIFGKFPSAGPKASIIPGGTGAGTLSGLPNKDMK